MRYTLIELRKLEAIHPGEAFVRELELEVDGVIPDPGYRVQFWNDVKLYGIDEAILYVKNGKRGSWIRILATWLRIMQSATFDEQYQTVVAYWEKRLK